MRSTRIGWRVRTHRVITPAHRIVTRIRRRVTLTCWSVVTVSRIQAIIPNISVHFAMRGIGVALMNPRIIWQPEVVRTVVRGFRRVVRRSVRTAIIR